jgi:hypothetical protein
VKHWCIPLLQRHRGSNSLSSVLFFWQAVNVGSHAHYIATDGEAHYPLIEAIAPDQVGKVDLVPCDSSPLKINLNMCLLFRGGATGWAEAHPEIWQKT